MVDFLSPEVITQEEASQAIPLLASSTSVTWMEATATRGPVNVSQLVTGLQDWETIYGKDDGGYGRQSAVGYFNNQGRQLIFNRVAHYTDITDRDTLTAVSADTTFNTLANAASVATKQSAVGPFDLSAAALGVANMPATLIASIDGAGADTMAIDVTPSVVTAPGVPGGIGTTGHTLTFTVNGVTQLYTVPAAPPTSATDWALDISGQLSGVTGSVVAGVVVLGTDKQGSAAAISYVSGTGTAGADSGFGAGPVAGVNAGPNDVADDSVVTATELETSLEADWTGGGGVDGVPQGDGSLIVNTVTTGVPGSISAVTGTAAVTVGFTPAGVVTGSAAGSPSVATLKFLATSEGIHGNLLGVTTVRKDRVIANITVDVPAAPVTEVTVDTVQQFRIGMQFFAEDTVTTGVLRAVVADIIGLRVIFQSAVTPTAVLTAANTPTVTKETFDVTFVIENVNQAPFSDLSMDDTDIRFFVGSVIGTDPSAIDPRQRIFVELQGAPLSNDEDPRPVDGTAVPLTSGVDSTASVTLDYIGSESTNTGLRAADAFDGEYSILTVPGIEVFEMHRAMQDYAELKKSHVSIINAPAGLTAVQVNDYITVTANLFSTYVIAYAGEPIVIRESSGVQETFPAAGYLAGVYARSDRTDNVASPPAGVRKGQIFGVTSMSNNNLYAAKGNRDILYPDPGVNAIWSKTGSGIVAWGQLTLDPNSDRGTIGVRRAMLALERDIGRLSDFVLFELNTEDLRQDYKTRISGYLRQQWTASVLQGANETDAFTIKCDEENNPPSVVNSRQFFAEIGVNVIPAIDYAIIIIRRDTRALEAELAAA